MSMNGLLTSLGRLSLQNISVIKGLPTARSISTTSSKNSLFGNSFVSGASNNNGIICPGLAWQIPGVILGSVSANSKLISDLQVRYRRVYKTKSRRFPGHIDVYGEEDGKRQSLAAAEERFKRLDWGVYIRTKVGKDNKRWKMTARRMWRKEQHTFVDAKNAEKFERMFSNEIKRARFFPDDPFEKFNRLSWHKHHWTKLKNAENIRRYGNDVYLWDRYKTHMKLNSEHNTFPKMAYMPPGYLKNVASNPSGVYTPDPSIPKIDVAPHFQRKQIDPPRVKKNAQLCQIRDLEMYAGNLPLWSPLIFPSRFPN